MQFFPFSAARADTGAVLTRAKVTVYLTGTTTKAALFNLAGASIGNPVSADDNGAVGFKAANGAYDLSISSEDGGYTVPTLAAIQLYDLTELDGKVSTVTTAVTTVTTKTGEAAASATAAATSAGEAATTLDAVQPIAGKDRALEKRLGLMTTNTTNLGVLQTDGTIAISAGTPAMTWDYPLTAADIAAGTVTVDWLEISTGLTFTVEQRSASAQIVAPVSVPLVSGYRSLTISPNTGGGTTILRLSVTGSFSASARAVGVPSVTAKRPVTVPTDPNYFAIIAERLMANDGAQISTLSTISGNTIGAAIIDGSSFSQLANADLSGTYGLSKTMKQDFVVLVTIASASLRPRLVDLYPIAIGGTEGAVIPTRQYRFAGKPNQFIVSVPHQVGGVPVIGFRVRAYTYAGGAINGGAVSEPMTTTARAYDASALPALRTVPTAVTKAISDKQTETLAQAASAAGYVNHRLRASIINQNDMTRIIAKRLHLFALALLYVSPTGSDAAAGTVMAPKQTSAVAVPAMTTGRALLYERGKINYHLSANIFPPAGVHFGAYGFGDDRAWVDSRIPLGGLTWANVGGIFRAQVTTLQPIVMSGTTHANSTHFAAYDRTDGTNWGKRMEWRVGGADQAANRAAVLANPGSFTINRLGSTDQDARGTGPSAGGYTDTQFEIWVLPADGLSPAGREFSLSQRGGAYNPVGGSLTDLIFIGAAGKDNVDPQPDAANNNQMTTIENCVFLDGSCHALTGPCHGRGDNIYANRAPTPPGGPTNLSVLNRSNGGGLELFTGGTFPTQDVIHSGRSFVINSTTGLYAHNSGAGTAYRSLFMETLIAMNCTSAIKMDGNVLAYRMFGGDFIVNRVESGPGYHPITGEYVDGGDELCGMGIIGGVVRLRSGFHRTGKATAFSGAKFIGAGGQCTIHVGEWGGFIYEARQPIGLAGGQTIGGIVFDNLSGNTLLSNDSAVLGDVPVFHLYGTADNSPIGKKGIIRRVAGGGVRPDSWDFELHLHNAVLDERGRPAVSPLPCTIGDLQDAAALSNVPRRFIVWDAGHTYGLGDRTREQMRQYYIGLGKVEGTLANPGLNVDGVTPAHFFFHPETWIVNRAGRIIDVPESLK